VRNIARVLCCSERGAERRIAEHAGSGREHLQMALVRLLGDDQCQEQLNGLVVRCVDRYRLPGAHEHGGFDDTLRHARMRYGHAVTQPGRCQLLSQHKSIREGSLGDVRTVARNFAIPSSTAGLSAASMSSTTPALRWLR
jgi:hypothetical protein